MPPFNAYKLFDTLIYRIQHRFLYPKGMDITMFLNINSVCTILQVGNKNVQKTSGWRSIKRKLLYVRSG